MEFGGQYVYLENNLDVDLEEEDEGMPSFYFCEQII
jgi:hypothetical protein